MENKPKFQVPERNPATHAIHRREVFWQITFPLIIALLLILGLVGVVIFAGFQGLGEVSRWADVSLIWLLLPALVVVLVMLLMLSGVVYLITRLLAIPRLCAVGTRFLLSRSGAGEIHLGQACRAYSQAA